MPRPAGSKNAPKAALESMLRRRFGGDFDAVVELADIAHKLLDEPAQLECKRWLHVFMISTVMCIILRLLCINICLCV